MKIVFMGTPDFAVPSLRALCEAGHELAAVFTQPDKPVGRKAVITPPPVKVFAEERGIPVYQPKSLKKGDALAILEGIAPDLIVVVAYGKILPAAILALPPHGCINVHGSLLPAYRGSAPVQWAIVHGETTTGVTTMFMDEGLDTGDILLQDRVDIGRGETYGELLDRLSGIGADLLLKTLKELEAGRLQRQKQDDAQASLAPMIQKGMASIDFAAMTAEQIEHLVAGMNPWPIAHTKLAGKGLKIYAAEAAETEVTTCPPGTVIKLAADSTALGVACKDGTVLLIHELQLEGSKRMPAEQFLHGRNLPEGTQLGL